MSKNVFWRITVNNTVSRRDQVAAFKKVFSIIKFSLMGIVSIAMTCLLTYIQYAAPLLEKNKAATIEGFFKYLEKTENLLLSVSYGICALVATCFVVFLIMHGIQTLVVKFMMRNSG